MNLWRLALGALLVVVAISLGALLSRALVVPTGTHRARPAGEETVTLAELFRPREVNDLAWCPAEQAERLHAFNGDGTRTCWTCRQSTPTGARRG